MIISKAFILKDCIRERTSQMESGWRHGVNHRHSNFVHVSKNVDCIAFQIQQIAPFLYQVNWTARFIPSEYIYWLLWVTGACQTLWLFPFDGQILEIWYHIELTIKCLLNDLNDKRVGTKTYIYKIEERRLLSSIQLTFTIFMMTLLYMMPSGTYLKVGDDITGDKHNDNFWV